MILLLAVLLLLCMTSCEDLPTLESGTAASKKDGEATEVQTEASPQDKTESETKSGVSWTPFV